MTNDRDCVPRPALAMLLGFSALFARAALWGLAASLAACALVVLAA